MSELTDSSSEEGLPVLPPANCLRSLEQRVVGVDCVAARFCRYSVVMAPLVIEGDEVRAECFEDCPHSVVFGADEKGKVIAKERSYDAAA